MSAYLLERFSEMIPREYRTRFQGIATHLFGERTPLEFRSALYLEIEHDKMLYRNGYPVLSKEAIDGLLFELLPFTNADDVIPRLKELLLPLPGLQTNQEGLVHAIEEAQRLMGSERFITAKQLRDLCKAMLCSALDSTSTSYDYSLLIAERARELGYAMPVSLRFADTNWVNDYFAFMVNPGNGTLELWRVNREATKGFCMTSWDIWLNGSHKDRTWGVYTKPHEYRLT
jgi:hypothetical protein